LTRKTKFVYIAGPMTGIEYFNFPMFDTFEGIYDKLGYEVFNPAAHDRKLLGKSKDWMPTENDQEGGWKAWSKNATLKPLPSLRDMLGADLAWIAKYATHIAMLPGWEKSRGANAEWALAKALDLEIAYYPLPSEAVQAVRMESRLAA